jgi:hypothetical protein
LDFAKGHNSYSPDGSENVPINIMHQAGKDLGLEGNIVLQVFISFRDNDIENSIS